MSTNKIFNSVQTTLKPENFGKRRQRQIDMKTTAMIQLFKVSTKCYRIFATKANNGTVSFFLLNLMTIANSYTNNSASALRPVFISTSLDPNEYITNDNRTVFGDSNKQSMNRIGTTNSPYNGCIANCNIGSALIPLALKYKDNPELNWDNEKYNAHAVRLAKLLQEISEKNTTDSERDKAFNKAWNEYMAVENNLKEQGILIENNILVAKDNGIIPIIAPHQQMKSSNKYLDGEALFSNKDSQATYCPLVNSVYLVGQLQSDTVDPQSTYEYGLYQDEENPTYKRFSKLVKVYDFTNTLNEEPCRIVLNDAVSNSSNSNNRTDTFERFCNENSMIEVRNAELRLGFTDIGGYSSRFELTGNNLIYKPFKLASNDLSYELNIDLDGEVELDSGDWISFNDSLENSDVSEEEKAVAEEKSSEYQSFSTENF